MKKFLFILIAFLMLVTGCSVMSKHRAQVREGLLTVGLNRDAFLKEWGMPDKTTTISSDEFASFTAGWSQLGDYGGGRAGFFKGKVPLDVWAYEKHDIILVFHGLRLVGWKTDKTREEIKAISRQKK